MTPKIQKAITMASILHRGQIRKGNGAPYILHPYSVAFILAQYTDDEDIIVAGLLHDVLEDVKGYTFADIARDFGIRVARIVADVSEDIALKESKGERESWVERKQKYLDHLAVSRNDSVMVACADKIHNLRSSIEAYAEQGDKFWELFNSPTDKKLWYYQEVLKIAREKLISGIVGELELTLLEAERIFK